MTVIVVEDNGTHTRYKEIWWSDGSQIVTERVRDGD
jgi:hypothetical protein